MKTIQILRFMPLVSLVVLVGCTSTEPYPISGSYAKINEMQILDPMAPENNAGIVNDLEGNYGKQVMASYQKGNYDPKEAKTSNSAEQAMSSGSN